MKVNIYIPTVINVGYQYRRDTYDGKLAYVVYTDGEGVIRKKTSWDGWCDSNIQKDEFNNEPTSGFVLNKKVGDTYCGWNHRQTYCRVYDPRGFEFEITIENLLYILENTDCIKGKGLSGEFVYGWDGKDLVLIPTCSNEYKELVKFSELKSACNYIKASNLVVGATYLGSDNRNYVYVGKFDYWEHYTYWKNGIPFSSYQKFKSYCDDNNLFEYIRGRNYKSDSNKPYSFDKRHAFYCIETESFNWIKSLGKKFIGVVDTECYSDFSTILENIECEREYSPIDDSLTEYIPISYTSKFYESGGSYYYKNERNVWERDWIYISPNGSKEPKGVPHSKIIYLANRKIYSKECFYDE